MRYYAAHGAGLVSQHSVLTWTGTKLQAQDVLKGERERSDRALTTPHWVCKRGVGPVLAMDSACHPLHTA